MDFLRRALLPLRDVREWRLSVKIVVGVLIVAVAAIFFFSFENNARSTEVLTQTQSKLLTSRAAGVADTIGSQVLAYRREATQVATEPDVISFMGAGAAQREALAAALIKRLSPVLVADPDYRVLVLLNIDGTAVLSTDPTASGKDFSQADFFVRGRIAPADQPLVSDLLPASDRRSKILRVSLPIADTVGHLLGVAELQYSPDHLINALSSRELAAESRNGFLVNPEGVILANSADPNLDYKVLGSLTGTRAERLRQLYGLQRIDSLNQDSLASTIEKSSSGFGQGSIVKASETDVAGWSPVAKVGWTVMVVEDKSIFDAAIKGLSTGQFYSALLLALIIGGLVLVVGRLFGSAERESLSDPLTGLANRRFFNQLLRRELARSRTTEHPLALVMIDIDHFKQINDAHGHDVGDEVLEQLANNILSGVRATDYVVRYGGEEFIVLLPETRPSDAGAVAEKLRRTVAESPIESMVHEDLHILVTVSAGVATFPDDATSGAHLVRSADLALYRAKQTGRNRVVLASDLEVEPTGGRGVA